ncbi:MAG: inositol monophosphatase [Rhodospirillales bacterium]|nr:inositol-1-monophosphatase [Rhodospirillaceae bacterium]MDP6429426.1 inositol monophosphatase [Rhodospirillales bacterium]MDP6643577.1 inositol monophosphatase [Rhodospirillales bacterium]MDP6840996.1 inositol monophosphatase [Rhodospirillales bacterium]
MTASGLARGRVVLESLPDGKAVEAAIRLIAAEEIMPRFRALEAHEVDKKHEGEIVTAADIESERRLEEELTGLVPDSVVVGEEGFAANAAIMDRLGGTAPVWVIDPLDGTRNFAEGKELFCVIVAFVQDGVVDAGWIYDPIKDDMMHSVRGRGVRDKRGAILLGPPPPTTTVMRGSVGKRRRTALAERDDNLVPRNMVRYRCVGREYMDLARGRLDFAEYGSLKPWDHAAGVLFHAEAGGYSAFTKDGAPYQPGPVRRGRFLIAPDRDCWHKLKDVMPV